jgi:hypothetical protein
MDLDKAYRIPSRAQFLSILQVQFNFVRQPRSVTVAADVAGWVERIEQDSRIAHLARLIEELQLELASQASLHRSA